MSQLSMRSIFWLTPTAGFMLALLSFSACEEEKKKEVKAKPAAVAGDTGGAGPGADFPAPIKGPLPSPTPRVSGLPDFNPNPKPNMTFIPGVGWQPVGGNTLPPGQASCVCAQYLPPYNPWANMLPNQGKSFGARGCQGRMKKGTFGCHAGRNKRRNDSDDNFGSAQDQQVAMLTAMVNQLLVTQGAGAPVNFGQSYNWGGMAAGVPGYAPGGGAFPTAGGVLGGAVPVGGIVNPGAAGMSITTCPMPGTVNPVNGIACQLWVRVR